MILMDIFSTLGKSVDDFPNGHRSTNTHAVTRNDGVPAPDHFADNSTVNDELDCFPCFKQTETLDSMIDEEKERNLTHAMNLTPRCRQCGKGPIILDTESGDLLCGSCGCVHEERISSSSRNLPKSDRGFDKRVNSRLGSLAHGKHDLGEIIADRQSISDREAGMIRGLGYEDSAESEIRPKIEAAVRAMNFPQREESELIEDVMRKVISKNRKRKASDTRVSLSKSTMYVLLAEAKLHGRTIEEVQNALAVAGFNIRLEFFRLRIVASEDVASVKMYINGIEQQPPCPKEAGDGPLGKEYSVNVQAFLSDALSSDDGWIEIRFEKAIVLPQDEPAVPTARKPLAPVRRWYVTTTTTKEEKTAKAFQLDPQTIRLRLNRRKCFALFHAVNDIIDGEVTAPPPLRGKDGDDPAADVFVRRHALLPSKKFAASAALMRRAGCLALVERKCNDILKSMIKNSFGRSPTRALAPRALLQADQEAYATLPKAVRIEMRSFLSSLPLLESDRKYTGVKGLLIPSEILVRE